MNYQEELKKAFRKVNLDGGFLHKSYSDGFENFDLTHCYVDIRVRNGQKLRKALNPIITAFLAEHPHAKAPFYKY